MSTVIQSKQSEDQEV